MGATTQVQVGQPTILKRMIAEFIGSFFLALALGAMVMTGKGDLGPAVVGITLMVMVFAGGHISGGHFNPAVTFGVWLNRGMPTYRVIPYFLAQCAGALVAASVSLWLFPGGKAAPLSLPDLRRVFAAEMLGTLALVYTVLNVAVSRGTANNGFFGLAIGLTVTAMAYSLAGISGGVFNPALAVGMWSMGSLPVQALAPYFGGQFCGGLVAAALFRMADVQPEINK